MKRALTETVKEEFGKAVEAGDLSSAGAGIDALDFTVERPAQEEHGDFSTNLAMVSAAVQKMPPRRIAEALSRQIGDEHPIIDRVEIAGPGFLNFFLRPAYLREQFLEAAKEGENFGRSPIISRWFGR